MSDITRDLRQSIDLAEATLKGGTVTLPRQIEELQSGFAALVVAVQALDARLDLADRIRN